MTITFLALAMLGTALIAAGCFVLWGVGVAMLVIGVMTLLAATVIARGAALNDPGS